MILLVDFIPENMKMQLNDSHRIMQAEFESERQHHQKLVKDYANLQGDIQVWNDLIIDRVLCRKVNFILNTF